ncbi:MAG: S8 family serine peptidase [Tannerellaceae bacterium]|jgi:subtilisin family serine protease|nr:S8 family serine peptidase [Tannerellaceae bacterium]
MTKHYIRPLLLLSIGAILSLHPLKSEQFCFRVYLNDKGNAAYSVDRPEDFLSNEAIERRNRKGIPIDESDMPIALEHLDALASLGAKPVVASKWLATVVVECEDSTIANNLQSLPIVDSVRCVWKGNRYTPPATDRDTATLIPEDKPQENIYGYAETQIKMLNGIRLHKKGYRGQGVKVAVIDAGFTNADRMAVFKHMNLAGTHNVVYPGESVFCDDDHGTKVLSCLAANAPGIMVGTAPDASYLLIKSEDNRSEYPIEEDYWTAAVEFADSAGVSVISSSLGYFVFDEKEFNYLPSMLDGQTAFVSRAADKAAGKGILLLVSSGNEGGGEWEKLTFPADAKRVLTVGSVTQGKDKSVFSSIGPAAGGRIKPDIMAMGTNCTVTDSSGSIRYANGTSFSTPIAAGLAVCLWQALPELDNHAIADLIKRSSSQYNQPDGQLGYGIPNFYKALKMQRP